MTYVTCAQFTASQAAQDAVASAATQTLTLVGQNLTISGGNTVALALNCPAVVACVTAQPITTNVVPGTTPLLGKDGQFHVLPPSAAGSQTLSLTGQTLSIAGGNSIVLPDAQTLAVSGSNLSISGGNTVDIANRVQAGAGLRIVGNGLTATPYVLDIQPQLAASAVGSGCPAVTFKPGFSTVGDVIFSSPVTVVTNPSSVLPASGSFTLEFHSFNAIIYPGSFYSIGSEVSLNGGAWQPIGEMTFGNQAGAVPINFVGSGLPSTSRPFTIAAGSGVFTVQTRLVLKFKATLTVGDEITSFCYVNSVSMANHN